jgi:hypothetical protein
VPPLFVDKFQAVGQKLNSPEEESLAVWWLSLDGQFRLPFNEADCVLLNVAFGGPACGSESFDEHSVSASLALDPRVFLIAAAVHTVRQDGHHDIWDNSSTGSQSLAKVESQLEPITKRRRKLLSEVQKRRDRYLRHLRGGSDVWELRRQLERLLRDCGNIRANGRLAS